MNSSVNENSQVYYTGRYWNDYPECMSIINKRLFGQDIDWKDYLLDNGNSGFEHALILNCGNGRVERELYDTGIIKKATAVEYIKELVDQCNKNKGSRDITYIQHDINTISFPENTFDCVINFAACHHIMKIEEVMVNITRWLEPNGCFIHNDYIGPQRNQYSRQTWNAMNIVNNSINKKYRKHLGYPDVQQMMLDDPTEAINSNSILPVLYDLFDIQTHTKSGGAIAYEILTHNPLLFNMNPTLRKALVEYIMKKDLEYMNATGESFFHFIVAVNTKNIDSKVIRKNLYHMNVRERRAEKTFGHYCYNKLETECIVKCDNPNSYEKSFFVHGFSAIESTGRWSDQETSIIMFKYENTDPRRLLLNVTPMPNVQQKVTINTNETENSTIVVTSEQVLEIPLTPNNDYPDEAVVIMKYHDLKSPKELGIGDDGRKLGLFFKWIKLI
tara:strand:+ start:1131 stop:2465 length:1335 start_codon:yes stop_codon:yes gene_type:complete